MNPEITTVKHILNILEEVRRASTCKHRFICTNLENGFSSNNPYFSL